MPRRGMRLFNGGGQGIQTAGSLSSPYLAYVRKSFARKHKLATLHFRHQRLICCARPLSFSTKHQQKACQHGGNVKATATDTNSDTASSGTRVAAAVERAAQVLPQQGILENFVHHNPLHVFESLSFGEAVRHVHELETYVSPGERMVTLLGVDPRKRAYEAVVGLSAPFLDRGAAKWAPGFRNLGFLHFFASLEGLGMAKWRKYARTQAKLILNEQAGDSGLSGPELSKKIVHDNLQFFGIPECDWEPAILSFLGELRGWSGMFRRMETHPGEAPQNTSVSLLEFSAVQSIILRSSIEAMARDSGWRPEKISFAAWLEAKSPSARAMRLPHLSVRSESAVAFIDQDSERREHLEAEVEQAFLYAINSKPISTSAVRNQVNNAPHRPTLQLYTCIDDRECSLRRHAEQQHADPHAVETFGVAGFFGLPIRYKGASECHEVVLAPEGLNPSAILTEGADRSYPDEYLHFTSRRRLFARLWQWGERASFSPLGSLALSALFPFSIARLVLMGFAPGTAQRIRDTIESKFIPKPHTDFEIPFSAEEAANLLARTFNCIGVQNRFSPTVVILGHGAASANNPFAAAYNCGACSGHEGGPNARLFARLANDAAVRQSLQHQHGIAIPNDTVFVGGMHNTTADVIKFYDEERIPATHREGFIEAQEILSRACGANALERCNRFLLANAHTPEAALKHVWIRSIDPAEVRPELNHASNAAVVVGRRELTQGRFFDRRAFLPSYDPFDDDEAGTNLESVLAPALSVCSGINLEYLFSAIAADLHGAGTKTPLNVVGNIGVLQGTTGDLRPGLPAQMTEMHTPVRALFVIDAPVERVRAVLLRRHELKQLVTNEWVRCIVRDPSTGQFFRNHEGEFVPTEHQPAAPTELTSFQSHREHGLGVARRESLIYWTATAGMLVACALPMALFGETAMNPHGSLTALSAGALALPVLGFSRRYLHGEFMFGRFAALSTGLLLGFNLVATAPSIEHVLAGWSLFGFASTFLIGSYNERPSVRNNATWAFAAYRISDMALLTAVAFSGTHAALTGHAEPGLVAGALLIAALCKSSQFPLTTLFARSMEGPTPTSALGYAGLSAHVGVVLLASTTALWFPFDAARAALAAGGLGTAAYSAVISKMRPDRKGAVAYATSSTLGVIFAIMAMGYTDAALLLSLGHAAFRMNQILRAPGIISDTYRLQGALGDEPLSWPKTVSDPLYRMGWRLHRLDTDMNFMHVLHRMTGQMRLPKDLILSKPQQWACTGAGVTLAGAPFTPLNHVLEQAYIILLTTHPTLAVAAMLTHFGVSVFTVRFLFTSVLNARRFRPTPPSSNGRPDSKQSKVFPSQTRKP